MPRSTAQRVVQGGRSAQPPRWIAYPWRQTERFPHFQRVAAFTLRAGLR